MQSLDKKRRLNLTHQLHVVTITFPRPHLLERASRRDPHVRCEHREQHARDAERGGVARGPRLGRAEACGGAADEDQLGRVVQLDREKRRREWRRRRVQHLRRVWRAEGVRQTRGSGGGTGAAAGLTASP